MPPECLLCHRSWGGNPDQPFCAACRTRLNKDRDIPACPTCAESVAPHAVDRQGRCPRCRSQRSPVSRTVRIGEYGPALGILIRRFKYRHDPTLSVTMGAWLARAVLDAPVVDRRPGPRQAEVVVPVPTTRWRRLRSHIHVPTETALVVAGLLDLPMIPVLRRIRGGPHQIELSHAQRIANVHGAFAMRRGIHPRGTRILLIDDVGTSGATLAECARVLRRAGATWVCAAILARAGLGMDAIEWA